VCPEDEGPRYLGPLRSGLRAESSPVGEILLPQHFWRETREALSGFTTLRFQSTYQAAQLDSLPEGARANRTPFA